jgi:FkbM family methyltransferase
MARGTNLRILDALNRLRIRVLPGPVRTFFRKIDMRFKDRRGLRSLTRYQGKGGLGFQYCIAYNQRGGYCVPLSSSNRPAAQAILAGDVWEPNTIDFLTSHAGIGDIIHAGTYYGDFLPALAHSCVQGAKVWAFEPNPQNYQCALITIKLNEIGNIELFNAGLGEHRGCKSMVTSDNNGRSLGGMSRIVGDAERGNVTVDVVTIDETVPTDRHVSVIQLDVEKFERPALAGAIRTIRRCRPVLVLETVPEEAWLNEHLYPLGYRIGEQVHDNTILRPGP